MIAHLSRFISLLLWVVIPSALCGQVSFSADTTDGCGPLSIQFTSTAPGASNVFWDFGDNSTSVNADPIKVYTQPGLYTVTLRAVFSSGAPVVITKSSYIQVFAPPQAAFSASLRQICWGTPVVFTDNSIAGSGNIVSWQWSFGDGRVSTQQNPIHTYLGSGSFNVSLQVTDVNGCTDLITLNNHVLVNRPDASFSYNNLFACNPPLTVSFRSTGTINGTHQWLIGSSSYSVANPSHTFNAPGLFQVLHIVTDQFGCSDTVLILDLVQIGQANVPVRASKSKVCVGQPVQFFCGSSLASSVSWNLGPAGTSSSCNPIVTYATPGTYQVTASLTFPNGCIIDGSTSITVLDLPDISLFTPDTFSCSHPFISNFSSSVAHAPTGSQYTWDFGDASFPSNLPQPTHTYGRPGTFDVKLTVVTPDGCRDSMIEKKMVYVNTLIPRFAGNPEEGCLPLDVDFFDRTVSSTPLTSINWEFGNGLFGMGSTPSTTYPLRGSFTVKLIVTDVLGCTDTLIKKKYINVGDSVKANFGPRDTAICGGMPLQFLDSSLGKITKWTWLYGDGNMGDSLDPVYKFRDTGYVSVMLIASDNGCKDTLNIDSAVYVKPVIASIGGFFTGCDTPFVAQFFNSSKGGHIWHWDFGTGNPGDTSNVKSPDFTYYQGTYWANLIALDTVTGCIDSMKRLVQVEPIDLSAAVDTNFGCSPITVNLSATSSHGIAQLWNLGDGNYANTLNVIHTYKKPGNFTVSVRVWNRIGCPADTFFYVNGYKPVVNFSVQDTNGCAPYMPVWTNNTGTRLPITSWRWDLGNGLGSNSRVPAPIYPKGHYSIKLVAVDSLGCTDSLTKLGYIYVNDPKSHFTVNDSINCVGKPIIFRSRSFGQSIVLTDYDFGDNTTSPQPVVTHSYAINGSYTATMTVTDSIGCQDVFTKNILIQDPSISLTADTTFATCPPLKVNFTGHVHSQHNFVRWAWDFGDGNTSNAQNPTYIYTTPGVFTVTLKAYSSTGCVDSLTLVDYVTVRGPDGELTFGPLTGCLGTTVTFAAVDSNTVSSSCDYGDGTLIHGTPRLTNFTRTYPAPGIYKPVLLLDDGQGCIYPVVPKDSIIIYPTPTAKFTALTTSLCDSGTVQFLDLSTSPTPIQSWSWDFGDGQVSSLQNPSHFYTKPDSYTVILVVTTIDGCVDSLEMPDIIIARELPEVAMILSDPAGCMPFDLRLSDNSPSTNATLTDWEWKSGYGGGQASGQTARFTYPNSGFYTINLEVTDIFGCKNDRDSVIQVFPLPVVDFTVLPDSHRCAPVELQFLDRVRSGVAWQWDFGDGSTSALQDPLHNYQQDGVYDVKLIVTDSRGCVDSLIKPAYIRLDHPEADFTFVPDEGCPPLLVDFRDVSLSDTSLTYWQWDFGDSNTGSGASPQHTYFQTGTYSVSLIVQDVFGCADTLTKENIIRVWDNVQPDPTEIRRVTVLSDSRVRIEWEKFPNLNKDFDRYELYREDSAGNWIQIFSTQNILHTYFEEPGLQTRNQSYCYKLAVVNYCENVSVLDSSETHCTVLLTTSSLAESIQLNWSAYMGFEVESYKVYRVKGYGLSNIQLIATVGPQTLRYVDTDMFCYEEVTYRIQADKLGENVRSYSNISANVPIHQPPAERQDMVRATVEDNQFVRVEWKDLGVERATTFVLEKNEGRGYRNLIRLPVDLAGNSYLDDDVEVDERPYIYRAYWLDSCGDRTAFGLPGKSIHLTAERRQGMVFLDWTAYKQWRGGVAAYQIEIFDEAASGFIPVAQVPSTDTAYQDGNSELFQGEFCYRIRAFERGGNDTISLSNEACVAILPQIYAPNAFSPNGDGYNEEFLIKGIYLETFKLRIFTRWGYKIFESNDQNIGWNGQYKEEDSPEGVYVFVVDAIGLDGSPVQLKGTVTLIR